MNTDGNSITEAQIRKAVRKAFKQLFKRIANEPTLVIESGEDENSVSTQSLSDIRQWLFRGR
jgi:hypothetical protein